MATIQDVAKSAHVGAATVSRVLSGKGYVKAETKEKVLRAIKELNYTPNEMARNLFYQKSGIVAVIVPEVAHPFFAEFVNAVEVALCRNDYQTMICNTWCEQNYELRYLDMLQRRMVDGIIFGSHSLEVEQYQNIQRPIVALDRELGGAIPCVAVDHREGGRLAAEALINAGCKNVFQFRDSGIVSTPSNLRYDEFERVMREHGIPCQSYAMDWNTFSIDYYQEITKDFLKNHPEVDGVFATDEIAISVLRQAPECGRRVPEDLKVVAYDGTRCTKLASPSITTVCQPISQLAEECVKVMLELIQGKAIETRDIQLRVALREGASTKRL